MMLYVPLTTQNVLCKCSVHNDIKKSLYGVTAVQLSITSIV